MCAPQMYTDKSVVNHKSTTMYPAYASLLGGTYADKTKGIVTLAYLPNPRTVGKTPAENVLLREALLSKCLELITAQLKVASRDGFVALFRGGEFMKLYPRLLSYVGDDPEQRQILCQYIAGKVARPCVLCYCARGALCCASMSFVPPGLDWTPQASKDVGDEDAILAEEVDEGDEAAAEAADNVAGAKTKHLDKVNDPTTCTLRTSRSQTLVRGAILGARTKTIGKGYQKFYSMRGATPGILGFAGMDQPAGDAFPVHALFIISVCRGNVNHHVSFVAQVTPTPYSTLSGCTTLTLVS